MKQLHINYAKIGYRATNKKKYIKQMTRWLTRQEKIHHFNVYLQWAVPKYMSQATYLGPDVENEHDNLLPIGTKPLKHATHHYDILECGYQIAKKPSYLNVPFKTVQDDFGADNILPCIETYLQKLGQPVHYVVNPKFSLFKWMYVWIPAAP